MSRAERLLDLLHALRRHRRPVSGRVLAEEIGVSIRTLYRDIASLQAQGAAIEGDLLRPGKKFELRTAEIPLLDPKDGHLPTGGNAVVILTKDPAKLAAEANLHQHETDEQDEEHGRHGGGRAHAEIDEPSR